MDSTNRRCPSAKMVSKASEDLPAPEGPVTTVTAWCGTRQSIPFRLWVRARSTWMDRILLGIDGFRPPPVRREAAHHNARSFSAFPPSDVAELQVKRQNLLVTAELGGFMQSTDPIRAARGMLKGRGPTTEELLTERRKERELEEKME